MTNVWHLNIFLKLFVRAYFVIQLNGELLEHFFLPVLFVCSIWIVAMLTFCFIFKCLVSSLNQQIIWPKTRKPHSMMQFPYFPCHQLCFANKNLLKIIHQTLWEWSQWNLISFHSDQKSKMTTVILDLSNCYKFSSTF